MATQKKAPPVMAPEEHVDQINKLIATAFEMMLMTHRGRRPDAKPMTRGEVVRYVRERLKDVGFPTNPCGMSWGRLCDPIDYVPDALKDEA